MKKIFLIIALFAFSSNSYAGCDELVAKHHAPDPSTKTMKQLERWVKRKVKGGDATALKECLVAKAADNPNKAAAAGN
jgi:hypothetical protein